jgi:hypothetical protein
MFSVKKDDEARMAINRHQIQSVDVGEKGIGESDERSLYVAGSDETVSTAEVQEADAEGALTRQENGAET